jgi:hypothetical protein
MTLSFVVAELLGSAEHTACCGSSAMQQQLTQHGTLPRRLLQLLLAGMRLATRQVRAMVVGSDEAIVTCSLVSNLLSALNGGTPVHAALQSELRGPGARQVLRDVADLLQALPAGFAAGVSPESSRALVQAAGLPPMLWQSIGRRTLLAGQQGAAGRQEALSVHEAALWVAEQMPNALATLQLAGAAEQASVLPPECKHTLVNGVNNWAVMAYDIFCLRPTISSAAQLAAWTAAVESSHRLLPLLADLQMRWHQDRQDLPPAVGSRRISGGQHPSAVGNLPDGGGRVCGAAAGIRDCCLPAPAEAAVAGALGGPPIGALGGSDQPAAAAGAPRPPQLGGFDQLSGQDFLHLLSSLGAGASGQRGRRSDAAGSTVRLLGPSRFACSACLLPACVMPICCSSLLPHA